MKKADRIKFADLAYQVDSKGLEFADLAFAFSLPRTKLKLADLLVAWSDVVDALEAAGVFIEPHAEREL